MKPALRPGQMPCYICERKPRVAGQGGLCIACAQLVEEVAYTREQNG